MGNVGRLVPYGCQPVVYAQESTMDIGLAVVSKHFRTFVPCDVRWMKDVCRAFMGSTRHGNA